MNAPGRFGAGERAWRRAAAGIAQRNEHDHIGSNFSAPAPLRPEDSPLRARLLVYGLMLAIFIALGLVMYL